MKFNISLLGAALVAALFCGCSVGAPTAAPEKIVHTVQPKEYSVPAQEGVTTKVLPDGTALSLTGTGNQEPIIIDIGWIAVQPNTSYLARYRVKPQALQAPASVYLLVREHEEKGKKAFTPYPKESSHLREVKPAPSDQWAERRLQFTTGANTHFLSGSLVVMQLKGELYLSQLDLLDAASVAPVAAAAPADEGRTLAQAKAEWEQVMKEVRAQAATRKPLTPRPLVFSRSQMKYDLGKNYYHQWNDRPLLASRVYRVDSPYVTPLPSYKRTLEEVVKYDIDGLAFFPETKGRMAMFEAHEKAGVPGVGLLPEFVNAFTKDHVDVKTEILRNALANPSCPRINGKVLITSYGAQSLSPAEWKEILATLRQRVGDKFIFLPSLVYAASLHNTLLQGKYPTRADVEKEKASLRSYLDVCDGIYFNYPPALRNKDRTFDADFYRNVFIPVYQSVLSEPAYRNKYLGLSAYKSHMSPERGNSFIEDGTGTLRGSFEPAMDAHPDVIVLPEWDEENENTSFRPTIYGGNTTERILRYYMSRIKAKAPTPVPGDDTSVPNLILSTRKAVTLGEKMMIELLNVPDGIATQYSVALSLQDEAGHVVRTFDPVSFDAAQLQEHRFFVATETLPTVRALVPVLTIKGYRGRDLVYDSGFHHVQIRATWNWDHMYVKQPLRNQLRPATATLSWQAPAQNGGPLTLTGTVSSPEELNLVEVLGDDDEVYAVDPTDEFFRDDPTRELFLVEYRSLNDVDIKGNLTLKNSTMQWLTNGTPLHQPETEVKAENNKIELETPASVVPRWIYLAVPKADIAKAVFDFNFDKAKFSAPAREVLDKKIIAHGFENGLYIAVQPYHRQIDMPKPLDKKQVSFNVQVWPEISTEQFHLRLTSVNGKQFRSRPLLLPSVSEGNNQNLQPLRVYSETAERGVDVRVAADRIPNLNYDFAPDRGDVLLTSAGRPFWATLGGFSGITTGRGTVNGLFRNYPNPVVRSAPAWVTEDGKPCLEFDGVGNFLELPRETLPWHGAFTLAFDVKPSTAQDQSLLIEHTVSGQTGLSLEIRDGKLQATFRGVDWNVQRFETGLAVPAQAWSAVQVRYDFQDLTLTVNGKSQVFPLTGPSYNIGFTVFGEGLRGNWFAGRLRNLRIEHNAR